MSSLVRAVAAAGVAGALLLVTGPVAQAAPTAAAAACITVKEEKAFGRGEISLCPQSDGGTRVTGYVEDLLPGWFPDGICVAWDIRMGTSGSYGPTVCPHFNGGNKPRKDFDYVEKFRAPVTGAKLDLLSA